MRKFLGVPILLLALVFGSCQTLDSHNCNQEYNNIIKPAFSLFVETEADNDNVSALLSYFSANMYEVIPRTWNQWDTFSSNYFANIQTNSTIAPNYPVYPSTNEIQVCFMMISNTTVFIKCQYGEFSYQSILYDVSAFIQQMIVKCNNYRYNNYDK